ncbi:MAG: calcium/sodium antiporter [Firmicutes bacterium]|nr:calcium/sodium antiporter [Bacillota bacterium]
MVYLIFILSLSAVTKGADWLVEGAVGLTKLWGISQIVVGATIVSLGTTLPENLISALAAAQGKGHIVVGTALGSILFNTAVILGLAAVIRPPQIRDKDTFLKAGTMVGVLVLFTVLALDLHIARWESALLALILFFYLGSNIWNSRRRSARGHKNNSKADFRLHLFRVGLGSAFVVLGAHYLLDSGVEIARIFGVPEAIIAFTLFAVGSSLPEFVTAMAAAWKGHTDLILGNVLGANTLNIIFVITTAGLIRPFLVDPAVLRTDVPLSLLLIAVLLFPAIFTKKISRLQGLITLLAYFAYIIFLILR